MRTSLLPLWVVCAAVVSTGATAVLAQSQAPTSKPASAPAPPPAQAMPPAPAASRPAPLQLTLPARPGEPATSRPQSGAESRPSGLPHARVRVSLKNGQKLVGIVKNNRMSERAEGFDFFLAGPNDDKAGLRLWYANAGQSYVFVSHREIASVVSLGLVSELEIRELEAKAAEESRLAREREGSERLASLRDRVKSQEAQQDAEERTKAAKEKSEEDKAKKAELEKAKRLLDRFSPDDGWGEDKKKAILAKKANHLYPDADELEFVKLFDEWKKAVDLVKQSEESGGDKPADKPAEKPVEKPEKPADKEKP